MNPLHLFSAHVFPLLAQTGTPAQPYTSPMDGSLWLPSQRSTFAPSVDSLYNFINAISIFFFFLIIVLMVYFVIRYRRRANASVTTTVTHNTPLEITWTGIPLVLVLVIFILGFRGYMNLDSPPGDALPINGVGRQWAWQFNYDNGATSNELHVPIGKPVVLNMQSPDVIHSFYVPHLRVQRNVIPRRNNIIWFTATEAGRYPIYCTQYCGAGHSQMVSYVVAEPEAEYELWKQHQADPFMDYSKNPPEPKPLVQVGETLYHMYACAGCHTVDQLGSAGIGPTWRNLAGHPVDFSVPAGGHINEADYAYMKESILYSDKKIVQGFPNAMPSFATMPQKNVDALIVYINSLSDKAGPAELPPKAELQKEFGGKLPPLGLKVEPK